MSRLLQRGIVAELPNAEALVDCVRTLRRAGYERLDAFSPHPVHGLDEALLLRRSSLGWFGFLFGLCGAGVAYLIQWYTAVFNYPLNVGGRPAHAVPSFVPIVFETAVLFSALGTVVVLFGFLRLPRLHHPLFDAPGFTGSSIDRYWVGVDGGDPLFDDAAIGDALVAAGAVRVERVGAP